jgi:hypothetical protein
VSKELKQLRDNLEAAGFAPGSPAFEKEERRQKVELCKGRQSVASCWDCQYFDHCELIKAFLRDIHGT